MLNTGPFLALETKSSIQGTHVIGESDPEEAPEAGRSLSNTMPLPGLRVRRRGCRGGVRGGVSVFICAVTNGRTKYEKRRRTKKEKCHNNGSISVGCSLRGNIPVDGHIDSLNILLHWMHADVDLKMKPPDC